MINLYHLLELVVTGAVAGFSAGLLGIGGGALLTPLLLFLYSLWNIENQRLIHIIFGTNLLVIFFFSLSSAWGHHKRGNVLWHVVLKLAPGSIIGSILGAHTAGYLSDVNLIIFFSIFLIAAAFKMILSKNSSSIGEDVPKTKGFVFFLLGLLVGFLGALLGIGGGIVLVPVMVVLLKYPIKKVIGTSSANIVFLSFFGMLGYIMSGWGSPGRLEGCIGYVWWPAAIPLIIGGVPSARLGAYVNGRINAVLLRKIFGIFALLISIKILGNALNIF